VTISFSLRELEAQLHRTVTVTTTERETNEGSTKDHWVWRDSTGGKWFWSRDKPVRYEMYDTDSLQEADGIMFLCPACFAKNSGPIGTHSVLVSFANRRVPDDAGSKDSAGVPSHWTISPSSTGLDDLVLTPSILISGACAWHGFVGSSGIPPGRAG
jgi:hypothetical protein